MTVYIVKFCDYDGCTTLAAFSAKEVAEQMIKDIEDGRIWRSLVIEELDLDVEEYVNRQYVWEVYKHWSFEQLEPVPVKDIKEHEIDIVFKDLVYVSASTAKEAHAKAKELFRRNN
jgi:hypothetical protein